MAQHGSHALSSRTRLLTTLIAGCFAGTALALPTGAQIAAGTAAITQAGNVLTVNNSANAILNWQQFNIAASEAVRFNQPSASSSVLNRVLGADPSSLLGQLTSNGRVWLVNPAGILVGPGARIDTAGFVASTLNLRNEDFLAGKLTFGGNAGAGGIVNQGAIATPGGGSVYLIAPNVSNEGLIATPGGETILAAGQTVQLLDTATPGVKVEVTGSTGNVTNLGSVVAEAGRVGMAGVLVRNSGTLNASSVVSAGGRIFLKASGDTYVDKDARITATGSTGGDIDVLGQRVAVMDRAVLDASGQSGGGSVLVGGDYQGRNAAIQNAQRVYVGPATQMHADAGQNGDGGKVIVWADEVTRTYGRISARGGEQGGNGGLVETSGHDIDIRDARVDAGAARGQGGQWLLDPATITITGGTGNGGADASNVLFAGDPSGSPGQILFADASPTVVYESELEGLAPGTNLVLEATDTITASGTFGSAQVLLANNSSLTLRTRNASGDASDGGIGIQLTGSGDTSNLEFKTQGTGTFTVQTGTGTSPQAALIDIGKLTTEGGTVTLNGTGNIVIRGIKTTPTAGVGGNISLAAGGYITLGGAETDARGTAGGGTVTLVGSEINVQDTTNIYADTLKVTTANGIHGTSAATAAATQVSKLNVRNTGAGTIKISNTANNLTLDDIGTVGYAVKQDTAGQAIDITNTMLLNVNAPVVTSNGTTNLTGAGVTFIAAGQVQTGNGAVGISAGTGTLNMPAGSGITNTGGVTLKADSFSLFGTITGGTADVSLLPITPGITMGVEKAGGAFNLTDAMLDGITAGKIWVGDSGNKWGTMNVGDTAGLTQGAKNINLAATTINFSEAAAVTAVTTTGDVSLQANTISGNANASFDVQANKLTVDIAAAGTGAGTVATPIKTKVNQLAGFNASAGAGDFAIQNDTSGLDVQSIIQSGTGTIKVTTTGSMNVSTLPGATSSADGTIFLGANGNMVIAGNVGAGTGTVTLEPNGTLTEQSAGAGTITGGTLNLGNTIATTTSIGTALAPVKVNPGTSVSAKATTGDIYLETPGAFSTNKITLIDTIAAGRTAQLTTVNGTLIVDSLAGFGANTTNDTIILKAGGAGNIVTLAPTGARTLTAASVQMDAPGGIAGGADLLIDTSTANGQILLSSSGGAIGSGNAVRVKAGSGTVGATAAGYAINLQSTGPLNLGTTSGANVVLTATAGGVAGSDPITAASLSVTAAGTVALGGANAVDNFSADVSSSAAASGIYFKNTKALDIGSAGIATFTGGHVGLWLTAGSLTQTGTISAANLVVKSEQGDVTLTGANTVSNVAAKVGTASTYVNRNFRFTNSSALNVGALLTPNGDFNTVSGIGIDIAGTFVSDASGGVIALTSAAGLTQSADALLGGKAVNANAATVDLQLANPTGVIAGAATGGSFQYKSSNTIFVTTVNGALGVQNTVIGGDVVLTSTGGGINQDQPISTKNLPGGGGFGLSLTSAGDVMLQNAGNNFAKIAANVSAGSLLVRDSTDLAVESVGGVTGITTNNTSVELATGPGEQLTVNSPINAGAVSGAVALESDLLDFVNTVTANQVNIRPYTADRPITVGATACGAGGAGPACLSVTNLWKVDSPTIGIGSEYAGKKAGAIYVAGITTGNALVTDKLATTTRIGLLSGAGITQGGAISVQDLGISADGVVNLSNAANAVTNLAGKTNGQAFTFVNSPSLNTALLSGGTGPYTYSMNGIATANGDVTLTSGSGDITLYHPINAGSGNVTLTANGAGAAIIDGNGASTNVSALSLGAFATAGIGHGDALETQLSYLEAVNSGANNIEVTNTGALDILSGMSNTGGNIVIDNTGALATGNNAISAPAGNVVLTAHSPLTIGLGGISSTSGNITLTAGSAASSATADVLTINGTVMTTGSITLNAHSTSGSSVPTGGNVTSQIYSAPAAAEPPPPPPPTVAECTSNPALSGCSSILPSLSACTADPTAAGCTAVLPTLATCTTDPTATGCTSVLPTLATCTTNPTAAGCTAVLPSLSTCTTNPTAAGCTSVLPTLAACTTTPTVAGCTAVLPSLSTCTTTPTAAGCTSVLPTLATCTTDPTAAGCTSVLPSLASCTTTPTAAGCTAVLPSLATCTTNPTATGCTVVLPTLASCTATPTAAGCTSVLPSVATCTTNPTAAGCTSVLPTLATCTTAPTTSGCTAVLPPLASCTTNATLEGCAAVLPTLASCSTDSTQAGCSTVLPPVAAATTTSIKEVVAVTASLTNTAAETTPAATPAAPTPTPLTTSGVTTAAVLLLNTNQTIGGTEGTFGGSSSTGTASSFSLTSASSGAAEADQPAASKPAADTSSDDKSAGAKDKKDDKKEDKKDEVQAKKQEDKPTTKKPPICS